MWDTVFLQTLSVTPDIHFLVLVIHYKLHIRHCQGSSTIVLSLSSGSLINNSLNTCISGSPHIHSYPAIRSQGTIHKGKELTHCPSLPFLRLITLKGRSQRASRQPLWTWRRHRWRRCWKTMWWGISVLRRKVFICTDVSKIIDLSHTLENVLKIKRKDTADCN